MGVWEKQFSARYIVFLNDIWAPFGEKGEGNSYVYHESFLCMILLLSLLEIPGWGPEMEYPRFPGGRIGPGQQEPLDLPPPL